MREKITFGKNKFAHKFNSQLTPITIKTYNQQPNYLTKALIPTLGFPKCLHIAITLNLKIFKSPKDHVRQIYNDLDLYEDYLKITRRSYVLFCFEELL